MAVKDQDVRGFMEGMISQEFREIVDSGRQVRFPQYEKEKRVLGIKGLLLLAAAACLVFIGFKLEAVLLYFFAFWLGLYGWGHMQGSIQSYPEGERAHIFYLAMNNPDRDIREIIEEELSE